MCCIQICFYVVCAIKKNHPKNSRWHFKLMPSSPSFRFYLKWPLKPLLRWTPCWETSHTRRKSHALEDSNLSDDVPRRWRRLWYWGNIAFCSSVYSTTCMSSATSMLPVCAHIHSAQYIISCRRKKKEKRKRELSQLWKKKKHNRSYIAHCWLFTD